MKRMDWHTLAYPENVERTGAKIPTPQRMGFELLTDGVSGDNEDKVTLRQEGENWIGLVTAGSGSLSSFSSGRLEDTLEFVFQMFYGERVLVSVRKYNPRLRYPDGCPYCGQMVCSHLVLTRNNGDRVYINPWSTTVECTACGADADNGDSNFLCWNCGEEL